MSGSIMDRRSFFYNVGKSSLAAGLGIACTRNTSNTSSPQDQGPAKSEARHWRLVMAVPKTLPIWGPSVVDFASKVTTLSRGELNISVYGAGELVPSFGVFDAVSAGQVEMGHSASYYWQGKMPAAAFFTAVPFGISASGMNAWLMNGGLDLWRRLYEPYNVIPFPAGNTGMQMAGWFNRPINHINDFKGLKMRIPGLGGRVIEKAGGSPMLVAASEIFTGLATGVLDAAEWVGPYHDYLLGLHKVATHYYYPGWQETGPTLELLVNKQDFEQLPSHLKTLVETCSKELDRDIYARWLDADSAYLAKIKALPRIKILPLPPPVLTELRRLAEEVKSEVAATSPLAKEIYQSFTAYQEQFDTWQDLTTTVYQKFPK